MKTGKRQLVAKTGFVIVPNLFSVTRLFDGHATRVPSGGTAGQANSGTHIGWASQQWHPNRQQFYLYAAAVATRRNLSAVLRTSERYFCRASM